MDIHRSEDSQSEMEKSHHVEQLLPIPNIPMSNGASNSASSTSLPRSPTSPRGGQQTIRKKLVVVGDGACGKTSLLVAYKDDNFTTDYIPTVFENSTATVPVENKTIELSLWDTAGFERQPSPPLSHLVGQEDYDRLRPLSYPDSNVILVCFAIDKPDSLLNIQRKWIFELEQYCPNVPTILVGCKSDLRHELPSQELISTEQVLGRQITYYLFIRRERIWRQG